MACYARHLMGVRGQLYEGCAAMRRSGTGILLSTILAISLALVTVSSAQATAEDWHRINDSAVSGCSVYFSQADTLYMCADQSQGCGALIRLSDATGEPGGYQIAFDDLFFCGQNPSNPSVCPGGRVTW